MPKSSLSASPSSKGPQDEASRLSDIASRKKKNAEAQAAFRARRANYIATLEETVTNLESVVIQLQDSCRDSRAEVQDLQQQIARLRLEHQERERSWRLLFRSRKSGQGNDDLLPMPPTSSATVLQSSVTSIPVGPSQLPYQEDSLNYRNDDACPTVFNGSEHSYNGSPSIPVTEPDSSDTKFSQYSYPVHTSPRDPRWQLQQLPAAAGIPGADATLQPSQSPVYLESPSLTASEMTFPGRSFGAPEEHKVALHPVLENAPYAFSAEDRFSNQLGNPIPASRSLSPSSTHASSSSALAPSFQFNFSETVMGQVNDRRDFDFRRHTLPHGEVTLHGGTADIASLSGPTDAVRYRLNSQKPGSGTEHHPTQSVALSSGVPGCSSDNGASSHHDRMGSDSELSLTSRLRRRRGTHATSRSPSPGPPSLSCTVAVIKAQAFGALRRPRARGKKSAEGAAKVSMDVLEARGIGIGIPTSSKRSRIDDETLSMET